MMKECRVIIINEESGELLENELIEEELADQIVGIVEDAEVDNYEECEVICSVVTKMLEEAGIEAEDHDEMIKELGGLKLVKKDVNPECIVKKIKKTKGKIKRPKKECDCE